jgi:hypothetical protein
MQRRGWQPAIHEAPASYALRLQAHLPAAQIADVNKFIALYLQIKYGKPITNPNEKNQQLKRLLKKIK